MQSLAVGESAQERIATTVVIDGESRALYVTIRWHVHTEQWTMRIQDEDGNDIVTHIPLMGAVDFTSSNLMRIFGHLGLGALRVVPKNKGVLGKCPGLENLNTDYLLVWSDSE